MAAKLPVRRSDITGATRLMIDATTGMTDLVEAMHARIATVPGLPGRGPQGRTAGITGFVYGSIRAVARAVGLGLETAFETLLPPLGSDTPNPGREAALAALNGVLGDHLAATGNPLAIPMALRCAGRPLPADPAAVAAELPQASSGVVVLIHGLCMNDLQWTRAGRDRFAEMAQDLGLTPLHLHYDSGLHIFENGAGFADRLEALLDLWPRPIERLVLIGHSMGGLVARSAFLQGETAHLRWPGLVSDMVFLGTPHQGAPLEKAGHWVDVILGATPYAAPLARLGRVRSAGITDLRHGDLVEADRLHHRDRSAPRGTKRRAHPLPAQVRCHAVAAVTAVEGAGPAAALFGDGLVPVASALGRHRDPDRDLGLSPDHTATIRGIGHLDLIWNDDVTATVRAWLEQPVPGADS
jgi:pimeloyl-ACP methyl ester carboxylesterase